MKRKKPYEPLAMVVLAVVIAAVVMFFLFRGPARPQLNPLDGLPFAYNINGNVFVNSTEAAGGYAEEKSYSDISYRGGDYWLLFVPYGIFNGNDFYRRYTDEGGVIRMSINSTLSPANGVIDGWAAFSISNDELLVSIFLDDDWKSNVGGITNIIWGDDWNQTKPFGWRQISTGVYMDSISMPLDGKKFEPTSSINLFVGNLPAKPSGLIENMDNVIGFGFN